MSSEPVKSASFRLSFGYVRLSVLLNNKVTYTQVVKCKLTLHKFYVMENDAFLSCIHTKVNQHNSTSSILNRGKAMSVYWFD